MLEGVPSVQVTSTSRAVGEVALESRGCGHFRTGLGGLFGHFWLFF